MDLSELDLVTEEDILAAVGKVEAIDSKRKWRIIILGPGGSGKDTLAAMISRYAVYNGESVSFNGSTSLSMLDLVYGATQKLHPDLIDKISMSEFYPLRRTCRTYWYNVIKAYRDTNPAFLIGRTESDVFVGSRDLNEVDTVMANTDDVAFVLCKETGIPDPTFPYTALELSTLIPKRYSGRYLSMNLFEYDPDPFILAARAGEIIKYVAYFMGFEYQLHRSTKSMERFGVHFDDVLEGRFDGRQSQKV